MSNHTAGADRPSVAPDSYAVGQAVVAVRGIWQPASDELPEQHLCDPGDVLEVRRINEGHACHCGGIFPTCHLCGGSGRVPPTWPVSVAHPYRAADAMFGVRLDEIRPA